MQAADRSRVGKSKLESCCQVIGVVEFAVLVVLGHPVGRVLVRCQGSGAAQARLHGDEEPAVHHVAGQRRCRAIWGGRDVQGGGRVGVGHRRVRLSAGPELASARGPTTRPELEAIREAEVQSIRRW